MFRVKNSKVLTMWLLSYLSVVMLPIIISLVSYSIYFNNLKKQNDAFNTYISDFTANHMKESMVEMRRMYADVTSHEALLPVLRITEPSEYLKNEEAIHLLSYMERTSLYRNEETDFFLYIPETEMILSSAGAVESRTYFDAYFGGDEVDFENWKETVCNQKPGFFFHEIYSSKSEKTFVEYCSIMPSNIRQYGYQAVFCATTEKTAFFQKVEEVDWLKSASIYIFNSKDELLLDSTENPNTPRTLHDLLETLGDDSAVLSRHLDFDTSVLNIVMVTNENNLLLQVISMRRLFLISTALVTIFSLALIVLMVKRNYRPIVDILTTIGDRGLGDEFTEIKQFVQHSQLKEEKQKLAMRQSCLTHLVKGTFQRYYLWEDLKNCGIVFHRKSFLVLIISVKNVEGYAEESRESLQKRFNELNFMITNVYEELYNNDHMKSYVINIDNYFVCVINADLSYEHNLQTLSQLADLGASVLNREYQLDLKFSLSKAYDSVSDFPEAYKEALHALNLRQFKAMNDDLAKLDALFEDSEETYYYDLELEQRFIHCIRTHDRNAAETMIEYIFELAQQKRLSDVYIRCLFTDMAFTLLKTVSFEDDEQSLQYIFRENLSVVQMKDWLLARTQLCCANQAGETERVMENILDYIYQNYRNEDLNIAFLSEKFDISSYYLSKRFRSMFGESLIDFIHKLRLMEAKELIRDGNQTMIQISQSVGYTNIRTFNRVFKKYEGITPSQYQQQN